MTREEAIAYGKDYYRDLTTACCEIDEKHKDFVRMAIQALSQEPCDKCKYFDGNSCQHYDYKVGYTQGYEDANNRFGQEPCDDAISREAVLDTTICEGISCNECSFNEIDGESGCLLHARIDELPPVTQKSGKR